MLESGESKWEQQECTIFFTIRLAKKIEKDLATSKCWHGGEEVDSVPDRLRLCKLLHSLGSLPDVFTPNKNTHLLTIKKSYFGGALFDRNETVRT